MKSKPGRVASLGLIATWFLPLLCLADQPPLLKAVTSRGDGQLS
jgi:hypothetical protein